MSKYHDTWRMIDGELRCCRDVGCDDFDRAKRNRLLVEEGLFTTFWRMLESWLEHTPQGQKLAKWIPHGTLPQVGKKDWQQYGGDKGGLYEIEE